jgi:putative ABC transport system permease protein
MLFTNARVSLRDLRRRPTFAAAVVLTVAVGIAAATGAFALVDAVFLTPLPVRDQGQLMVLSGATPPDWAGVNVPWAVPWELRQLLDERRRVFAGVTAYRTPEPYPYEARDGGRTLHVEKTAVAGNFFEVLGVKPVLGRLIDPGDDVPGGPDVTVLSNELWQREFGGDRNVIGRLIFFAGAPRRVIGVAPPEFDYPAGTNVWVPTVEESYARWRFPPDDFGFFLVARLQEGVASHAAQREFEAALQAYKPPAKFTETWGWGAVPSGGRAEPYTDVVMGHEVRPGVIVLFSTVLLVLVIACSNIAGLLLARGIARSEELRVRIALGATRWQLVTPLLSEAGVLALGGAIIGLAIATALVRAAVTLAPPDLPMLATAHLDVRVLAFAATITIGSILAFGLAPAFRATRASAASPLRGVARSVTGDRAISLMRRLVVAGQVALTVVVLTGAALLGRSLAQLQSVPLGFDPTHLLYFRPDYMVPSAVSRDSAFDKRYVGFLRLLPDRLAATPGLGRMTTSLDLPFSGEAQSGPYILEGETPGSQEGGRIVQGDHALDDYFGVIGTPIVRGRTIRRTDDAHAPPAVVVNSAFAKLAWPGQDPIGRRIRFPHDSIERWWTVVGVAADTRYSDPGKPPGPTVFTSERQGPWLDPWYVVRTRLDPRSAVAVLDRAIQSADPSFGLSQTKTGPQLLSARLARPRALATLFAGLAGTALFLAALGLFGILAAYVSERRREIAIRSAIGATRAQVRHLVLVQTLAVAGVGVACGIPMAFAAAHLLGEMVRDVRPLDALTLGAVGSILLSFVGMATYGPMVRATRVDARTALAAD